MQVLGAHLEVHDAANLCYRFFDVEKFLEDLELVVLNATHVKGVLDHVLQVQTRVQDDLEIVLDPCVNRTLEAVEDHADHGDD